MAAKVETLVVPVKDLEAAKATYAKLLGVDPYADTPYYVGFRGVGEVEIGLDPNGHAGGMTGPVAFIDVDDLDGAIAGLVDAGGTVQQPPTDVGDGKLIARVTDADGNVIGLARPA